MRRLIIGMGCAGLAAAAAAFATGCGELSTGCAATEECVSADASTPDASDATTDRGVDAPAGNEGGENDGAIDAPISSEAGMDGGSDADSGDASPPPVCDLDASPHDSPCVAGKDMGGVFVAPATAGGKDGAGRGTKGAPYATLGYALGHLGSSGRVYVCGATFAEAVTIGAPAQVYGGLDCAADAASPATWAPIDGGSSTFAGPANVPALWVKGVTGSVAIEDTQFVAAPGDGYDDAGNGQSSIAVFASNSSDVTLRRCVLQAGEGHAGSDGVAVAAFDAGAEDGRQGTEDGGGAGGMNGLCGSQGGGGGLPAASGAPGLDGTPGPGNGQSVADCLGTTAAGPGINGDGGAGGDGAAAFGTLSSSGWLPVSGEPGAAGSVGQGGGGGASVDPSGGGGGGGAGGCGGAGGAGGGGGGSSFAVVVFQSGLDLVSCQLSAGDGGAGGRGADGQVGQARGLHGNGLGAACQGGNGGFGGGGGGGGGGASGLSAAVIWSGSTAPTIDGVSLVDAGTRAAVKQIGAYGAPGAHGAGATAAASGASPGADGTDGKAGSGAPPAVVQLP